MKRQMIDLAMVRWRGYAFCSVPWVLSIAPPFPPHEVLAIMVQCWGFISSLALIFRFRYLLLALSIKQFFPNHDFFFWFLLITSFLWNKNLGKEHWWIPRFRTNKFRFLIEVLLVSRLLTELLSQMQPRHCILLTRDLFIVFGCIL